MCVCEGVYCPMSMTINYLKLLIFTSDIDRYRSALDHWPSMYRDLFRLHFSSSQCVHNVCGLNFIIVIAVILLSFELYMHRELVGSEYIRIRLNEQLNSNSMDELITFEGHWTECNVSTMPNFHSLFTLGYRTEDGERNKNQIQINPNKFSEPFYKTSKLFILTRLIDCTNVDLFLICVRCASACSMFIVQVTFSLSLHRRTAQFETYSFEIVRRTSYNVSINWQ